MNLPTYLTIPYEIPYFPGLAEDQTREVPKKWIEEKKVANVLEGFEKSFEVLFSAPTDIKVPVDFADIVKTIRAAIPAKRLYDIRVVSQGGKKFLVQGSNMLRALRIFTTKTRIVDLGLASTVESMKYLEIRIWNSNMTDDECDVMVEILKNVWNDEYAVKPCDDEESYCQAQQCEAELPLAVDIRRYLRGNKRYEDQGLEKDLRRMRLAFGETHEDYVQNVLTDLLATKTRIPVIRNCPKIHLDGTYWPGLYTPGPFYEYVCVLTALKIIKQNYLRITHTIIT